MAVANLENAKSLLTDLRNKVNSNDIEGGKLIMAQLKIAMLDFPPDSYDFTAIAIETLELGVLLSVADDGDMDSFARYVAQVKPYYNASLQQQQDQDQQNQQQQSSSSLKEEQQERKCHILGLNLMHLLVENRLSEFHGELELLTDDESRNKYVTYPIMLERQLMVGSYDEVLRATSSENNIIPNYNSYEYFVISLLQTVRDSIADCLEVAYKTMTLNDAKTMMRFDSINELKEYVNECRDDWILSVDGNELCFQPPPVGSKASDVPSMKLIQQSLSYATELERIV